MQRRVRIADAPYWGGVYNDEPGVWVVVGEVLGQSLPVTGKSERQAIENWCTVAKARLSRNGDCAA
jgi:hypothetical protein